MTAPLRTSLRLGPLLVLPLLLAGCDGGFWSSEPEHRERTDNPEILARGENLYQQYCVACHGENREGAENWRQPDEQGNWPPPPLDGSAHTWHHPWWQLKDMIRYGGQARGGTMPSFEEQIDEEDAEAIIYWLQSHWPDEVYEAWLEYDRNTPTPEDWEEATGEEWVTHAH
ncbi:cytochrome c [Thioalkalivibrio sp. ALJ24]|uniref:c-type cytochrome n=1 Tax=Thioalkalivibrio sp. ALJ24 TaxID=545276 RepID=UPI00036DDE31|nr:cytochrome c [Thioalkalivibrio sp. ALJ24]